MESSCSDKQPRSHLQPLAATCSHLQPLAQAATCSYKQPLGTTCRHLPKQPLAATCSHLQPLAQAATCSHKQPLATTCRHLPKQPLAATCPAATCPAATSSHKQPVSAACPAATCSHLQPLAATGKWLQMAAFLKIKVRTSCARNEISATDLYAMSLCKISIGGVLAQNFYQMSLGKISFVEAAQNLYGFFWQDLCKGPLGKISTDLYTMSMHKLPIRGLLARSVSEISAQALHRSSLGKISTDLYAVSLDKISL